MIRHDDDPLAMRLAEVMTCELSDREEPMRQGAIAMVADTLEVCRMAALAADGTYQTEPPPMRRQALHDTLERCQRVLRQLHPE